MSPTDLAVVEWSRPEGQHIVHAFTACDRIPFRSLCGSARWSVKAQRSESGPACAECVEIVERAAQHLADTLAGMRNPGDGNARQAYPLPDELELRAMFGDR